MNTLLLFQNASNTNIRITLNGLDLYDIEFVKITRKKDKTLGIMIPTAVTVSTETNVYCDQMKEIIERETGLYLSL